jgi:hypothetical protein
VQHERDAFCVHNDVEGHGYRVGEDGTGALKLWRRRQHTRHRATGNVYVPAYLTKAAVFK